MQFDDITTNFGGYAPLKEDKMKKSIRLLSMLLVLVFAVSALCACNDSDTESSEVPGGGSVGDNETSYSYGPVDYGEFPYKGETYDGDPIRILCVDTARHKYGVQQFTYIEENEGNVINSAVQDRNNFLSENYGIEFEVSPVQYPNETLEPLALSDIDEYDLICESVDRLVLGVTEDYYWSLDGIMDLSHPWWDAEAANALSLSDKHYFLTGAALLTDDDNTYLTLFNKDMFNSNSTLASYGNIYDIVREGKFTVDLYYEMCKAVSQPDSNGEWSYNATYGNLSHAYGATVMMNGCGVATVAKNEQGELYLNVGSEYAITAFDKVYELMSDLQNTARAELVAGQSPNVQSTYGFAELEELFVSKRGLFYNTTASSVSILKSVQRDFEFGVLPIPKYNAEQDDYHCTVNRYQSSAIAIPSTVPAERLPELGFALQALAFYNTDVIRAYYQTTLQLQAIYTDDDAEMLDIVYNSRFYDIGAIYGWGNVVSLYGNVIANSAANTLVSSWEAIESAVESAMNQALEAYENSLT